MPKASTTNKNGMTLAQLRKKMQKLKAERGTWENYWQDLADHCHTRRASVISKKTDGARREFHLLDNIGVHCNEVLAGALHSFLTNPNGEFFTLTSGDYAIDNQDDVRKWTQAQVRKMHNVLANSNFQTEVHEFYLDLPAMGTANVLMEEDTENVVRFSTKFIADYFIDENRFGEVDENYREWCPKPAELIAEFGDKDLPEKVLKAYKENPDTTFKCWHAVFPKNLIDPKAGDRSGYIQQYFLPDEEWEIGEPTRFKTFPYLTARWGKASGEKWGRGPGMNALPELKVLNRMNQTMLIGAQKMVDPPLQMEDDGVVLPLITRPGGINFRRPGSAEIRPIFANTNVEFGYQAMQERRQRVRDAFFVDQLQLQPNGPQMTATEVLQRTEDSMRLLGPMLGRMQTEFLKPLIDRLYDIMDRRGMIDLPPQALQGRNLAVRYSSVIARSQRASEGRAILNTFQNTVPFIQLDPTVADNFNGDQAARIVASIFGAPAEIIRDTRERDGIRQQRQEAAQAQAQAQQEAMEIQQGAAIAQAAQSGS